MQTVAVVPIFINAGAAILPTVVAAIASVLALVFKPRELLALCARRPIVTGGVVGAFALCIGAAWTAYDWRTDPTRTAAASISHIDWAQVAVQIIAQEQARASLPAAVHAAVVPATEPATPPRTIAQDFARTGFDGSSSPVGLKPFWTFRPEDTLFLAQPVVFGGRIYAAGCQADLGGYTGLLVCLDEKTGKPIWQVTQVGSEFLRALFSSPALSADGKYLVIGQGLHEDRDCSLLCFQTATGNLHWSIKTPLHLESSPAVFGDMVVIGAGAIEGKDGAAIGDPGYVLAARISDGKVLWQQPVNDPESSPAIDADGTVYIGSGCNGNAVVAIRSATDEELTRKNLERIAWRTPTPLPALGAVTLSGDLILIGTGNGDYVHSNINPEGAVYALDRRTGAIRWQRTFADAVLGNLACRDGMVICPSRTGEITSLKLETGEVLWHQAISGHAPVLAGSALAHDRVYAMSSDGYLAVLNAKDGAIVEKLYLNDQAKPGAGLALCPPQITGGHVLAGSETGGLICFFGAGGAQ